MKKTIIALMALAGVAAAAVPNDLNIAPGGNFWGGDFTLTFTLNEGALSATDTIDVLALYWGSYSAAEYYSNGITLTWSSDDSVSLYIGDGKMSNVGENAESSQITETTTFTGSRGATFATTLSMGETYTLKNVGGDGAQTVSLYAGASAAGDALETVTYNGNMNGGNASTTMGSLVNAQYAVASVPEPTTATLSLLALAGLAARRRRK